MEKDYGLEFNINGEQYVSSRHNTYLFTFYGEMALLDHVYLVYEETGDEEVIGGYIWSDNKVYESLVKFIKENDFPQRLNCLEPAECDKLEFIKDHPDGKLSPPLLPKSEYGDVEDLYFNPSFPEDWIDGS